MRIAPPLANEPAGLDAVPVVVGSAPRLMAVSARAAILP